MTTSPFSPPNLRVVSRVLALIDSRDVRLRGSVPYLSAETGKSYRAMIALMRRMRDRGMVVREVVNVRDYRGGVATITYLRVTPIGRLYLRSYIGGTADARTIQDPEGPPRPEDGDGDHG